MNAQYHDFQCAVLLARAGRRRLGTHDLQGTDEVDLSACWNFLESNQGDWWGA